MMLILTGYHGLNRENQLNPDYQRSIGFKL